MRTKRVGSVLGIAFASVLVHADSTVTKEQLKCLSEGYANGYVPSVRVEYEMAEAYTKYGMGKNYFKLNKSSYAKRVSKIEATCESKYPLPNEDVKLLVTVIPDGTVNAVAIVSGESAYAECVATEFFDSGQFESHELGYFNFPYYREI